MNNIGVHIRDAQIADASDIARIHVAGWQAAYKTIVSAAYLQAMSLPNRENLWRQAIAAGAPNVTVARTNGEIIGWAAWGSSRDSDRPCREAEIEAFYVAPEHWRKGTGALLMHAVLERMTMRAFKSVSLWVLNENINAKRFYEACGFVADRSSRDVTVGGRSLLEDRYLRFV